MKTVLLSLGIIASLSACSTASNQQPKNKSKSKSINTTLKKEIDSQGVERFSFSADFIKQNNDVPKTKQAKVRRRLNPQRVQSSKQDANNKPDPSKLDMLEQTAVSMLDKGLNQKKWCTYGYKIDEKYWQNTTFRILGHCID